MNFQVQVDKAANLGKILIVEQVVSQSTSSTGRVSGQAASRSEMLRSKMGWMKSGAISCMGAKTKRLSAIKGWGTSSLGSSTISDP